MSAAAAGRRLIWARSVDGQLRGTPAQGMPMHESEHHNAERHGTRDPGGLVYWWPVLGIGVVLLLSGGFVGLAWHLQASAYELGARAMGEFPGDEVEALSALVQSEERTLAERNRAVQALGQIGDSRALPTLETFHTGQPCQHDKFLCQRELRKAIDRCRGKNWAPAWVPFLPHAPAREPGT